MSEEIKDIGSFFQQSFNEYRVDSGINEWALMKKKLFWQNFFKLSVHTFNVYYASIAIAASVFVSTEVYTTIYKDNPPQENTTPVIIQEEQKKIEIIEGIDSVKHKAIPEEKTEQDPNFEKDKVKDIQEEETPKENSKINKNEIRPSKIVVDTIEPEQIIEKKIDSVSKKKITVDSVDVKPIQNKPIQKDQVSVEKSLVVPDSVEKKEITKDSVIKVKKEVKIQVTPQQMREIKRKKRQQKKQTKKNNSK